jgi:hypothetical protein
MEDSFQRHDRHVDVEPQGTYCDLKRLYQAQWDGASEQVAIRRVPAAESGNLTEIFSFDAFNKSWIWPLLARLMNLVVYLLRL